MLPAVLLIVLTVLAGTLATYLYDDAPLLGRAAYGAVTGLAVSALVAFVLAHFVGIGAATVVTAFLAAASIGVLARTRARDGLWADVAEAGARARRLAGHPTKTGVATALFAFGFVLVLWLALERVVIVEPTGISTGYVNNLGDLPFHMQVVTSFAFGQNFPPEDPTFAGTAFAYPYMADFAAAMLVSLGATLAQAFFITNLVLALALAVLVHRFTMLLTRDGLAALIAPVLVFLSGGLGWVMLLDEARASEEGLAAMLMTLPHDYTIGVPGYRWGNALTTLFVTQRSLLFGLPLGIAIFGLLWRLIRRPPPRIDGPGGARRPVALSAHGVLSAVRRRPEALVAGIMTGLLPLVHAHSFVVVMVTAFLLGVLFRQWRDGRWLPWAIYVVAALAIALPEIWWSTHDSTADAGTFFGLQLGWDRGDQDPVSFWLLNTGLFIPLSLLPLAVPALRARLPAGLVLFTLPFLVWFVLPNLVKLAPWIWDNIKVLFYWYVGFVPLVALFVAWLLRNGPAAKALGGAVLATLVLAGSLDVWRVMSKQTSFLEFDADGISLAGWIREHTPPRSLILHAPTWNPPVFLTGRRSLMGYTGYIWAHGLDYVPRETDIKRIYGGDPEAGALLASYGIDYVAVTPLERSYMTVSDEFFRQFREVAAAGEYRLFQITP